MSRQTKLIFAALALLIVIFALFAFVIKQRRTTKPIPPTRLMFSDTDLYQKMAENLNSNNIRSFEIDVESEIVIGVPEWTRIDDLLAEGFSEAQAKKILSYIDTSNWLFSNWDFYPVIIWLNEGKVVHYSTLPGNFGPSKSLEYVRPGGKFRVWKPENQGWWTLTSLNE